MGEERDTSEPHGAAGAASAAYRERASRLPGAVLWTKATGSSARPVLPDGCTDLIWSAGRLLVAGPDTGPHLPETVPADSGPDSVAGRGGAPAVGLRFAPGQGPSVFGVPAHELRNLRVPLEDLWPAGRVREAAERVAASGAPGRVLEETAAGRLREAADLAGLADWADRADRSGLSGRSARTAAIAAALARGRPVADVALSAGLSARQLHRHSLDAFGYGPKTLARVLRFVRALDLARSGMPYAEVAARAGFADQAHLAREVKSLAGAPMGVLLGPG
ncbi:helix-turn-helix domain-containing protein [Streptomyces sp. NPDC050636]|uniref:helix-turn-helix domain-containing protein n=1 Tax=Streptomyces sp. NPDC050636 TaxID=3154510 RepID=UPI00341B12A2